MAFPQDLAITAMYAHPEQFNDFRRFIRPEWIKAVLEATDTATLRRRHLPAEQVVWLVIGMALFRDRSRRLSASSICRSRAPPLPQRDHAGPGSRRQRADAVAVRAYSAHVVKAERTGAPMARAVVVRNRWQYVTV